MSLSVLRWQFELTWSLFEIHLDALTDADCHWEPAQPCWTVRKGDCTWFADFASTEPDPVPAQSIGWLTWHIGWWWSSALAAVAGEEPYAPEQVSWPGDAESTVDWLRALRRDWLSYLDRLDAAALATPAPFPWRDGDHTVAQLLAWANFELAKNVAEIGQLRMRRALG